VPVSASLEPAGDRARLTISQRPGDIIAALTGIGIGVAAVLGLGTLLFDSDSTVFGVTALVVAAVAYFVVRYWYDGSMRRTEAQFEAALERAARMAEAGESATAATEPATHAASPMAQVSLDDLTETDPGAEGDVGRRLRT
jgi:Flp pilus assembly protein TadB